MYLIPLPAPICDVDYNYKKHGDDWKCGCDEKYNQSPINLPEPETLKKLYQDAKFDYATLKAE